jgi:hypothetical protein
MKICMDCGNTLKGQQRKYCSGKCRQRGHRKRIRELRPDNNKIKICMDCGNTLKGLHKKYCSGKCRTRGHRKKPGVKEKERKLSQTPEAKANQKAYRQRPEVKAYQKAYLKEYREENKEAIEKNRKSPKMIKYLAEWYQKNKERIDKIRQSPEVRKTNKKKRRAYNQRPEIKARKNKYVSERMKNDVAFKILMNIRGRTRRALSRGKNGMPIRKFTTTQKLLGCSIPEFMKHIENQFEEGMNWDNHGTHGWHVDHEQQCATFDLPKPEEQKECFHYTNQRPLWAKDNLSRPKPRLRKNKTITH